MEETKQLKIGFGALVPPIAKQLKIQGFNYDEREVKGFEKMRECITHLFFGGILNDSEKGKATMKLYKQITRHVIKKNKLSVPKKVKVTESNS